MEKKKKRGRGRPKGSIGKTSKMVESVVNTEFSNAYQKFIPKFMDQTLPNSTIIKFYFAGEIKDGKIIGEELLYNGTKVYICETFNHMKYPVKKTQVIDII